MALLASQNGRIRRAKLANLLSAVLHCTSRRKMILASLLLMIQVLSADKNIVRPIARSCRRLPRTEGWWLRAWNQYDDKRFKKNFRITKATFAFILDAIRSDLERETVNEIPISPEARLPVCLYRLGRGDYLSTLAELNGMGTSTVCTIVVEVCKSIVKHLWQPFVSAHFPLSPNGIEEITNSFKPKWQFPCCFGAVDGCHIPIKFPRGGQESAKEYRNFKNFYSIVIMAIVDAKMRFTWASSGFPGNSHDAIIFQSTKLYEGITERKIIPDFETEVLGK